MVYAIRRMENSMNDNVFGGVYIYLHYVEYLFYLRTEVIESKNDSF